MKMISSATLSTSRQRQFRDLLRVAALASEALQALDDSVTLTPKVRTELYVNWLYESLAEVLKAVESLDLRRVAAHDAAGSSGDTLIRDTTNQIHNAVERQTSGASYCLAELLKRDLKEKSYTPELVDAFGRVGSALQKIRYLIGRIRNPKWYPLRDGGLVKVFLVLFVLAIPTWYFLGSHGQTLDTSVIGSPSKSVFKRIVDLSLLLWNTLLAVPSVLLVGAGVTSLLQRRGILSKPSAQIVEEKLRVIRQELEFLNVAQTTKPVRIRIMTGDINTAFGSNINQIVKSKVNGAFNSIKEEMDPENKKFLKEVADVVEKMGDKSAAEHYETMVENLKVDNKSMAKSMWEGLLRIAPDVGKVASAATAVGKLFG